VEAVPPQGVLSGVELAGGGWVVERAHGSPAAFHARAVPEPAARAVWVFTPERPALVLGSTQPEATVDAEAAAGAGVEVVRRRSGGGAVLLVPDEVVWVDVVVPAGDPLWDDDVGRATWWLGEAWVSALAACGVGGAAVHRDRLVRTPWSQAVCFAGLGPGEVTVGGRKVVGISQRRTRTAARFQCAAYRRWDPGALVALLAEPRPTAAELADVAATIPAEAEVIVAAFVAAISRAAVRPGPADPEH
jgi:lipoate-protein ligase A